MKREFINGRWEPPYTAAELARKSDLFAQMCATRIPPGASGSDRTMMNSTDVRHHGLQEMPVWMQERTVAQAKAAGINITGKIYKGGLADYRGAACPEAWVSDTHDIVATARKRNLTVTSHGGTRTLHKGQEVPPKPDKPLSDKLVAEHSAHYLAADPKWREKPKQELKEFVIDRHGAPARGRGSPNPEPKI